MALLIELTSMTRRSSSSSSSSMHCQQQCLVGRLLLVAVVLLGCLTCSSRSQSDVGWIVSGPNHTSTGLPSCSFCLNVINAVFYTNWTDMRVGMYRCLKQDQNELWTVDAQRNTISLKDPDNQTLCFDTGSVQTDYRGGNLTVLPLRLRLCDGSARQRWFFDAGTKLLRSNLTDSDGSALYAAQGEVNDLPGVARDTDMSANYNLYLSRQDALTTTPGFVTADFTFQSVSNYRGLRYPGLGLQSSDGLLQTDGNLLTNGGFERTTILTRWPRTQNCSSFTRSCSRLIFFSGELFSLCSWVVVSPPELVYNREPLWKAADGVSSLLLSKRAFVNQTFASQPSTEYRLSFSMAGILAHSPSLDSYVLCTNNSQIFLTVQVDSSQPQLFGLDTSELSTAGRNTTWVSKSMLFNATDAATTISISSVGTEDCGPVIDSVKVTVSQAPPPALPPTLPAAPSSSHARNVAGIAVGVVAVLLLVLLGLGLLVWRRRRVRRSLALLNLIADQPAHEVKVFSYAQLEKATANWSTLLGEGGFSKVYRGEFTDGTIGAVKVEKSQRSTSSVFKEELALLLRVSHRHLVNLIGFCAEKEHPILVFEFLPNGNLYDRLHRRLNNPLLWQPRMRIVYQLSTALSYLHHGTSPPVGHRDIKSANVLLTATDSAKLADFGLSKSAPTDATTFLSEQTDVKGSLGYLDPKYVRSGVYSLKSDVYSYGVVVLELLTGQSAIKDTDLLSFWAAKYINDPSIAHEMLDSRLNGEYNAVDLQILVDLVKMCLQDDVQKRPTMQQVVSFLAESHFSGCPPASAPVSVPIPETTPTDFAPDTAVTPLSSAPSSFLTSSQDSL